MARDMVLNRLSEKRIASILLALTVRNMDDISFILGPMITL